MALKTLGIFAMTFTVAWALRPAFGQASDHHADTGQRVERSRTDEEPSPSAPTRVAPVGVDPNKQLGTAVSKDDALRPLRVSDFPPVSVTRDWMDRLAILLTVVLVIVGICGVTAANKTLRAIRGQGNLMRRQADLMAAQAGHMEAQTDILAKSVLASQASAEAALESAKLQRAQLQQWVEVVDWEVKSTLDADRITINCFILNPTNLPITILDIKSDGHFEMPHYPEGTRLAVSPKGRCLFLLPMMRLTKREVEDFDRDRLMMPIVLTVSFVDAFGETLKSKLAFEVGCGRSRYLEITPLLLWTTHPEDSKKSSPRDGGPNST
jgi:hypothetical protein